METETVEGPTHDRVSRQIPRPDLKGREETSWKLLGEHHGLSEGEDDTFGASWFVNIPILSCCRDAVDGSEDQRRAASICADLLSCPLLKPPASFGSSLSAAPHPFNDKLVSPQKLRIRLSHHTQVHLIVFVRSEVKYSAPNSPTSTLDNLVATCMSPGGVSWWSSNVVHGLLCALCPPSIPRVA